MITCNVLVRLLEFRVSALFNLEGISLRRYGGIVQLVEHLLCKQGVIGSSPIISTKMGQ